MRVTIPFIFALLFLTTSCSNFQNHMVKPNHFLNKGDKAIVAVQAYHPEKGILYNRDRPVHLTFTKLDSNYFTKNRISYHISHTYFKTQDYLMLEPGTYVIDEFFWVIDNGHIKSMLRGINNDCSINYGVFQVKEKSIYDLGTLIFQYNRYTNSGVKIEVEYEDKKVKKSFAKMYPELKNEQIKRLKLYPQGNRLSKNSPEKSLNL